MSSIGSAIHRHNLTIVSGNAALAGVLRSALAPDYMISTPDRRRLSAFFPDEKAAAVILDVSAPGDFDITCEEAVDRSIASGIPVLVMAGDDHRQEALDLVDRGAHSWIRNPPAIRELKISLRKACDDRQAIPHAAAPFEGVSPFGLDQLVGSGAEMQLVYKLVRKVANLENSVLITGESGTGKELVARAIHNTGSRAKRPFVAVSCGAIPETLIESELFGHERGAFTGSVGQHAGLLEQAADGTVFLDEIGELSPQIQVKLLRVLQEHEFNRLGSTHSIPLRARVILATHRDLEQMVAQGQFRQDLFYRINVLNIKVPPLRRRREDIPLLVPHFIRKYSEMYRKPVDGIEPEALEILQVYSWPGNVRELENVVQGALIMTEGRTIAIGDLPEALQDLEVGDLSEDSAPSGSFERLIRDYKLKVALEAIEACGGNKTLAAQSLQISRCYLHRLIRLGGAAADTAIADIAAARSRLPLTVN